VGVAKSLFTLPFIPSHQGRGSLIADILQLAARWFISRHQEMFERLKGTVYLTTHVRDLAFYGYMSECPAFQRAEFYSTPLNLGKAKKNPTAASVRIMPLNARESGVPILSASAPKGTALRGMSPKVIMAMLTMRPRISGLE